MKRNIFSLATRRPSALLVTVPIAFCARNAFAIEPSAPASSAQPAKASRSAGNIDQDELDRLGVNGIAGLGALSPFVDVGEQEGHVELFMRGIGSLSNTEMSDPATATFVDGVYLPRQRSLNMPLFDVERVELTPGPQGMLRGRNAMAGTLDIVNHEAALGVLGAKASLHLGNYSEREGRAALNVPILDHLALRVAAFSEAHASFFENAGPIRQLRGSDQVDNLAFRASLRWEPTAALKLTLRQDYFKGEGTGSTGSYFQNALNAGILPDEVAHPRAVVYRSPQGTLKAEQFGLLARVEAAVGAARVEYQGSYRSLNYRQTSSGNAGVDFPGRVTPDVDLDNAGATYWHDRSWSTAHELRASADTWRFHWSLGTSFFYEAQKILFGTTNDQVSSFAGVELTYPKMISRAESAFAHVAFDILEALHASAGVRLTRETKQREGLQNVYLWSGISSPFRFGTDGFAYAERGGTLVPQASSSPNELIAGVRRFGVRDTLADAINQPGVTWQGESVQESGRYAATFVDVRLGIDADLNADHRVWCSYSTGHKSGGIFDNVLLWLPNGQSASFAPSYGPETLRSLEVGSENELLKHVVTTRAVAFAYRYDSIPLPYVVPNDNTFVIAARPLAPAARAFGIEAATAVHLPGELSARGSLRVLDARYEQGEVLDDRKESLPTPRDLAGNRLSHAPVLSLNYSLGQRIETALGSIDWLVSAQTKTKQHMLPFNGDGRDPDTGLFDPHLSDVVPAHTRVDVGAGFTHPKQHLRLDAFISNLTNVAYMWSTLQAFGFNARFYNPPRQFGARLTLLL